jgi:hypothetical protein
VSSVLIRPEDGQPDSLKALLRDLTQVADGEPVRVESTGVSVSRKVALAYLKGKNGDADTSGRTVDNTRAPLVTVHTDASTGNEEHPDDSHARSSDLVIGGLTPEGEHPGGYEGVRADQTNTATTTPAQETEPKKVTAPAKKSTPAKKTAAAAQRDGRSTRS